MTLKEKELVYGSKGKIARIKLVKNGAMYSVIVDKEVYKTTSNELFAVQVFNAI